MISSLLAWLWAGLILGVSFVATPTKFLAPSLSLPVALDIGRATFHTLRWLEGALAIAVLISVVAHRSGTRVVLILAAIIAALLLQYLALLPVLDSRVDIIINGGVVPSSKLHWIYTIVEFTKACLLIYLGSCAYRHAVKQ